MLPRQMKRMRIKGFADLKIYDLLILATEIIHYFIFFFYHFQKEMGDTIFIVGESDVGGDGLEFGNGIRHGNAG